MRELEVETRGPIAIFTLNRPEKLNALSPSLMEAIETEVAAFDRDPALRVGIVTGAGRAFCAGADLGSSLVRREAGGKVRPLGGLLSAMSFSASSKPFIAAINGLAVGGGFEIAIDCDIRICSRDAYFGLYEPKRGLLAAYAVYHLPRIVGSAAANQLLLCAERAESAQALQWGVVSEVLEPQRLMPRALELAQSIAGNAPLSVHASKAIVKAWRKALVDDAVRDNAALVDSVLSSDDAKEGSRAFLEKRKPAWRGR
jgi:crotonobetainyl-CoA hydratase